MHAGLAPVAARSRRITPKPVPCASCRSTMASATVWRSHAASASSSVAAVATTSTRLGTVTSSTRRSAICGESSTTSACITSSSPVWIWNSGGMARAPGPPSRGVDACMWAVVRMVLGDELVLHRIVCDVGIRLEVHLLEDARAVGAHRLHAEEELLGDFRNALAGCELAEDLELAFRELRMRGRIRGR